MRRDELIKHRLRVLLNTGRLCLGVGVVLILHVLGRYHVLHTHLRLHLLWQVASTHLLVSLSLVALKDLLKVEGVLIGSKNIVLLVAGAKVWIHCKGLLVFISITN